MASGWGGPVVAVLFLWGLVALACSPVLASVQVQSLLRDWPTDRLAANYALLVGAVVLGQTVVFFAGVIASGGLGGSALVEWTILVAAGYPVALWLLVALGAPAAGYWTPSGDGIDGRVALGLGAIWYAIVVAVAAAVVFFALFVLYFPG